MLDSPPPPPLWRVVFGDDRPVEVEIGPGRGDVLLAYAAAAPERGFFGIERRGGQADAIVARAGRLGLTNVRAVGGDARCILARLVPAGSVAAYHIYFPDPWPKTRHRHRRLFDLAFVGALVRTLAPGGLVHVASDLSAVVARAGDALAAGGLIHVRGATMPPGRPTTRFERKYAEAGTYYARFTRP
jgi:tRNA (guanine-N7-)-methyltransferase